MTLSLSRVRAGEMWLAAMPAMFVFLWSTGFIGAKLGLPYAGPFTFLALRFSLAAALMLTIVLMFRAPWPATVTEMRHIATAGVLVHGCTLGAMFYAQSRGLPAAVAALIGGMLPLATGVLAGPLLGERVTPRQWLGLVLGLAGLVAVLWDRLTLGGVTAEALAAALFSLSAMTLGTLYQKRYCAAMNLRSGAAIQFLAATALMVPLAYAVEDRAVVWAGAFLFALAWLVLVLSVGAITILWVLIRRGAAAKVSSLFYLTPPVTAVMAWLVLDERLGAPVLAGMAVVMLGVALVTRGES